MADERLSPDETHMVHVRLPVALIRRLDHLAVDRGVYRAVVWEEVLREGLRALEAQEPPREYILGPVS